MWGPLATSRIRHSALASADKPSDCCSSLPDKLPYLALSWGVGLVAFPSCLGLIQVFVFRPLRLTCAVWGSSLLGLCSVAVSGIAASVCMTGTASCLHRLGYDPLFNGPMTTCTCTSNTSVHAETVVLYGVSSLVIFLCLGGRFSSVLPSSLIHPGAFAKHGISATLSYASASKKRALRETGKRHGCHTCGRRWLVKDFIADHQPPNVVVREHMMTKRQWYHWFQGRSLKQAFYPQCSRCSDTQAAHLRTTYRSGIISPRLRHIITHPTSLRFYHLYVPLPFLIAMIKSLVAT